MKQTSGVFSKFFWLLMAFHILWVGSEFPEAMEEKPVSGYTLSEKKASASSFLKRVNNLPGIPDKMMQEEILDHPDYVPLGLKERMPLPGCAAYPSDKVIPFKEINRPQFLPDRHYPPPKPGFS